jgi:hypothetical protein
MPGLYESSFNGISFYSYRKLVKLKYRWEARRAILGIILRHLDPASTLFLDMASNISGPCYSGD